MTHERRSHLILVSICDFFNGGDDGGVHRSRPIPNYRPSHRNMDNQDHSRNHNMDSQDCSHNHSTDSQDRSLSHCPNHRHGHRGGDNGGDNGGGDGSDGLH